MDRNTFIADVLCDASIDSYNNYKTLTAEERAAVIFFVVEDRLKFDQICATVYRIVKHSKAADTRAALAGRMWLQDTRVKQLIKYTYSRLFVRSKKAREKAIALQNEIGYQDPDPTEYDTKTIGAGRDEHNKRQKSDNIDKAEALAIIWKHLQRADKAGDSKTVSELASRLEAMKFKKEQDDTAEEVIRRYMPLRCGVCPLYLREKNKKD